MIVLPLILILTTGAETINPGTTSIYTQTERWNYISLVSTASMSQQGTIRVTLNYEESPGTVLALAIQRSSVPTFIDNRSNIRADYIDYNGWKNARNSHYIIVPYSYLEAQQHVYIGVGNALDILETIQYSVAVEYSLEYLCPADCSGYGKCNSANECDCSREHIDYDCGVTAQYMDADKWYSFVVPSGQREYAYYELKDALSLTISVKWNGPSSLIVFDWDKHGNMELPTEDEFYQKTVIASTNSVTETDIAIADVDGKYIYIAIMNILSTSNRGLGITLSVHAEYEKEGEEMRIILYILIVFSGLILVLWMTASILRCRANRLTDRLSARQSPRRSTGLPKKTIEEMSFITTFANVAGDKNESLCTICMDEFVMNDYVRKLACDHLFHAKCIEEWFANNSCCCLCKRDYLVMDGMNTRPSSIMLPQGILPVRSNEQ